MNNIRTAIYVRVSTTKDSQKDSPEHQQGLCEEKARQLKLKINHVYKDTATGTSIVARPEVNRLISDAEANLFDVIIFTSLSRLSRDSLDSLSLKRILVDALKIRVISIEEDYDSKIDKEDEFKFQIMSAVNQKLAEQISLSTRRGRRQSGIKGNFTGSVAPFGYKKANINGRKTLEIDCDKSEIVRLIFDLYTNNSLGEKAIVNYLNDKHIPSAKGGNWGLSSIQRILTNAVYTGENVFSKYEVKKVYNDIKDMTNRSKKQVQTNQDTWEKSLTKTHEPIISDEQYKQAQDIRLLRGGGKRGGVRNKVNLFAGFIFCGQCGSAMISAKSKSYRYLICSRYRRQGKVGCDNHIWIPYEELKNLIINEVSVKLKKAIDIDKAIEANEVTVSKPKEENNEQKIKKLEKKIDDLRKFTFQLRKDRAMERVSDEQFEFENRELEGELKSYLLQIEKLKNETLVKTNEASIKEEIRTSLNELVNLDYDDFDALRIVLMKLIEEIRVSKEAEITIVTPLGSL